MVPDSHYAGPQPGGSTFTNDTTLTVSVAGDFWSELRAIIMHPAKTQNLE